MQLSHARLQQKLFISFVLRQHDIFSSCIDRYRLQKTPTATYGNKRDGPAAKLKLALEKRNETPQFLYNGH